MLSHLLNLHMTPPEHLRFVASCVVAMCVCAVLGAVLLNFMLSADRGKVQKRERGPVATGTMMLFFAAFYALIHRRIGVVPIDDMTMLQVFTTVGLVLVALGAAVNIIGRLYLGANWANHVTIYSDQTLVTSGIFGIVRHPLYASLIWMFYGATLVYQNVAAAIATTLIFVPAMAYRASREEALLEQQFTDYGAYKMRVGRFLPKLRRAER